MTKLIQWLLGLSIFLTAWLAVISEKFSNQYTNAYRLHFLLIPVYAIISFGSYCLLLLIYRVISFNDCPEAADELKKQIKDAKEDLKKKGFVGFS